MLHRRIAVAATALALGVGLNAGTALAASSGSNQSKAPDRGNCLGTFQNQGVNGFFVSNFGPPEPDNLGQTIGKEEHGCR
jgi:hypothetical protein